MVDERMDDRENTPAGKNRSEFGNLLDEMEGGGTPPSRQFAKAEMGASGAIFKSDIFSSRLEILPAVARRVPGRGGPRLRRRRKVRIGGRPPEIVVFQWIEKQNRAPHADFGNAMNRVPAAAHEPVAGHDPADRLAVLRQRLEAVF